MNPLGSRAIRPGVDPDEDLVQRRSIFLPRRWRRSPTRPDPLRPSNGAAPDAADGGGSTGGAPAGKKPVHRRKRLGTLTLVAFVILIGWILVALLAPTLAPYDPLAQSGPYFDSPSGEHVFGTDQLGRDILSRIIHGARMSLPLAFLIVALSLLVGGAIGVIAGYIGHAVDEILMRFTDLFFAFPQIILAMAVAAAFGPSTRNAVIALVLVSWPVYARVVRSAVLSIRTSDFLYAARLLGVGPWKTLRKDVLPNSVGPSVVLASLELGNAVLLLASLSFLGLGPRPPAAEWGAMIAAGSTDLSKWWVSILPGVAILTVVVAFNLIGDAVRDWLDPRGRSIA